MARMAKDKGAKTNSIQLHVFELICLNQARRSPDDFSYRMDVLARSCHFTHRVTPRSPVEQANRLLFPQVASTSSEHLKGPLYQDALQRTLHTKENINFD